jgi:hypothetical protein
MSVLQEGPVPLEGLQIMLSRETAQDPPQSYIITLKEGGGTISERQVTNFPHPHPEVWIHGSTCIHA